MEFTVGGEGSLSPQHWRELPRCVWGEGDEQKLRVTACGLVARAVEAAEGVGTVERGGQRVTGSWRSQSQAACFAACSVIGTRPSQGWSLTACPPHLNPFPT